MNSTQHFCDPNVFDPDSAQSDLEVDITKWVNLPLALILLVTSPFIIVLPFVRENLNNNCRKLVSYIVLCDFISNIAQFELSWGKSFNQRPNNIVLCMVASVTRSVFQTCSMAWLVRSHFLSF